MYVYCPYLKKFNQMEDLKADIKHFVQRKQAIENRICDLLPNFDTMVEMMFSGVSFETPEIIKLQKRADIIGKIIETMEKSLG